MRVVKPGSLSHRKMYGTCRECGCEVADVEATEAKWMNDDRPGGGTGCLYIDCPTPGCNTNLYLKIPRD